MVVPRTTAAGVLVPPPTRVFVFWAPETAAVNSAYECPVKPRNEACLLRVGLFRVLDMHQAFPVAW